MSDGMIKEILGIILLFVINAVAQMFGGWGWRGWRR